MSAFSKGIHDAKEFLGSRRFISVMKGALAYTLAVMLPLIYGFDELTVVPTTYSAGVVVAIAGFPGKSVGECVFGAVIALLGVAVGAGNFAILSKLRVSLVAQAVVFGIMVYILAIIKALDPRTFAFALLAILMTFNGVYISILTGGFEPAYLESYFKSYLWGGAIVLGVNMFVFPVTTERELREAMVQSLDHIGTFAHLLAKTYTMSLTDEDRVVRDQLNQTIRQDFGILNAKVGAASIEVNWTRWSIQDYRRLIAQTRGMQLSLIALYSALAAYEKTPVPLFEEHFLPSTIKQFHQLRRDTHRTIVEIQLELGCKSSKTFGATANASKVYYDLERQAPAGMPSHPSGLHGAPSGEGVGIQSSSSSKPEVDNSNAPAVADPRTRPNRPRAFSSDDMRVISARLVAEAEQAAPLPEDSESDGTATLAESAVRDMLKPTAGVSEEKNVALSKIRGCALRMKQHFHDWEIGQRELLTEAIVSGKLTGSDTTLRVKQPRASLWETYGPDHVRGRVEKDERENELRRRQAADSKTRSRSASPQSQSDDDREPSTPPKPTDVLDISSNHSLMRVFSVLFAMDQFTTVLAQCHATVKETDAKGRPRQKRLRFHLFDGVGQRKIPTEPTPDPLPQAAAPADAGSAPADLPGISSSSATNLRDSTSEPELSMKEAMAMLEGREYIPVVPTIWQRLDRIEALTRTPLSVYAMKLAAAALAFGAILWADGSRQFFITYTISGSLITIVVALTPTLGQSLRSFVFQIAGSSLGYITGLVILEIFKNVGGRHFNPYGIVCLVGVFSIPMSYLLYMKPALFTFTLLAMNACGVLIIGDYISIVHNHNIAYGEPPIRVGRALAGLAIALAIVITFQLFVLRNPARRTLRKALAELVYSNLSYNNILQTLARATMSADPNFRPPRPAVKRILAELAHRETKIQAQILGVMPLVAFAQDEPQLAKPFQAAAIARIIRANQLILDRHAEARTAMGSAPFSPDILENFVATMSPYRKRMAYLLKARFCLTAASLSSKTPLPHTTHFEDTLASATHDALVQSRLFASTPGGMKSIQSGEFTRYWFYLLTITSLGEQLGVLEDSCRTLFGEIEDDPRLR